MKLRPVSGVGVRVAPNDYTDDKLLHAAGLKLYQTIAGSLRYLARVPRYGIAYTTSPLSRACGKPAMA